MLTIGQLAKEAGVGVETIRLLFEAPLKATAQRRRPNHGIGAIEICD